MSADQLPDAPRATMIGYFRDENGVWLIYDWNCAATPGPPTLTASDVLDEVRKRVPHVPIGTAPGPVNTIVNLQTLFWADTSADRDLGTAVLLGQFNVTMRIHVDHVSWEFGDGSNAESNGPGKPFTDQDFCDTVECPGFFGHIYRTAGTVTARATVTWEGQYEVDGGAWQSIPQTVAGPTATATLRVQQARSILVR